ncbi:unnamed protein product [Orchesella dallaii]|uniref:Uncharacterized protein n=1 Tax=Orchesella dallaii TaxID=48710 RepID=A0ABP1RBP7_9HEXA
MTFYYAMFAFIGIFVLTLDAVFIQNSEIVDAANQLISVFQRHNKKNHPGWCREDPNQVDIVGFVSAIFITEMVLPAFLVPALLVIEDGDAWFHIFKLHFSFAFSHSIPALFARFVLSFVSILEFIRCTFVFGVFGLIIAFTTKRSLSILRINCVNPENLVATLNYYVQLELVFIVLGRHAEKLFLVIMAGIQVSSSVIFWLCISHWEQLPPSMRLFLLSLSGLELASMLLFLVCIGMVCEQSEMLVVEQKKSLYTGKGRKGTQNWKSTSVLYWKLWSARRKLGLEYGIGLKFQRNTSIKYMEVLSNNTTNLVLLMP